MSERGFEIVLCRREGEHLTMEALASSAGLHPAIVDYFVEFGLLDPVELVGSQVLFEMAAVPRLRLIQRLRGDIGVNLAGVAVILDMLDRLRASQGENERLRGQL